MYLNTPNDVTRAARPSLQKNHKYQWNFKTSLDLYHAVTIMLLAALWNGNRTVSTKSAFKQLYDETNSFRCGRKTPDKYSRQNPRNLVGTENTNPPSAPGGNRTAGSCLDYKALKCFNSLDKSWDALNVLYLRGERGCDGSFGLRQRDTGVRRLQSPTVVGSIPAHAYM